MTIEYKPLQSSEDPSIENQTTNPEIGNNPSISATYFDKETQQYIFTIDPTTF